MGADAVGWCIEVLDVPGELMQFLLPEPEPTPDGGDDGARWNPSPADANKWHQVTVMGRAQVSCNRRPGGEGKRGWEGLEEGRGEQQQQQQQQQRRQNVAGGRDKEMVAEQQQEGGGRGRGPADRKVVRHVRGGGRRWNHCPRLSW